jgi:hypothetical protein
VLVDDDDTIAEAAEVQMLDGDVLTPYLGECLCVRMLAGAGELCTTCGGHVGSLEFNGICTTCDLSSGVLLNCFACNLSFHRDCMTDLRWGLTGYPQYLTQTRTLPLHRTLNLTLTLVLTLFFTLQASLYQHRGAQIAMRNGPNLASLKRIQFVWLTLHPTLTHYSKPQH